jgi:uncharacterized protein
MEKRGQTAGLTSAEIEFVAARDSFYLASLGENGFPYIQHRGGPKGFLQALDKDTLACFDFSGNRQYMTLGNLTAHKNVSMILMDYPNRARLKCYARVEVRALGADPEMERKLLPRSDAYRPERILVFHIEAFDWNCAQHITPRYTEEEIAEALAPYRSYVEDLEKELEKLKDDQRKFTDAR